MYFSALSSWFLVLSRRGELTSPSTHTAVCFSLCSVELSQNQAAILDVVFCAWMKLFETLQFDAIWSIPAPPCRCRLIDSIELRPSEPTAYFRPVRAAFQRVRCYAIDKIHSNKFATALFADVFVSLTFEFHVGIPFLVRCSWFLVV